MAQDSPKIPQDRLKMVQDRPKIAPKWSKIGPKGTEKSQDGRKTAKSKNILFGVAAFFAEAPRETLVFSKKKKNTPGHTAGRPLQSPGEGVGGGVNPSPKGKEGVVRRLKE